MNYKVTALLLIISSAFSIRAQTVSISDYKVDQNNIAQITVNSRADKYYILKVEDSNDPNSSRFTSMALGNEGTTTLSETMGKYPKEQYEVLEVPIASAMDSDKDGIDDLTEFRNPEKYAPFNPAKPIDLSDGMVYMKDHLAFKRLSYKGSEIAEIDPHLADLEFVKFYIIGDKWGKASLYFMNSEKHKTHSTFKLATGINTIAGSGELPLELKGEIVFHPNVKSPNGTLGVYRFEFEPNDSFPFNKVHVAYELISINMPFLKNNLAYFPMPSAALPLYFKEKPLYDASRVPILLEDELFADVDYMALNQAEGYGLLRKMNVNENPGLRDVVIYAYLPNEMPRTAGIITTVPQTPLSHVNLRAVQDKVPNAFIRDALNNEEIDKLIGKYVHYKVSQNSFSIEEASLQEVNLWFDAIRPKEAQTPPLDLSIKDIRSLSQIRFENSDSFGAKCANLAEMRTFGFPSKTIPDGFGVPFYFYQEFMKFNGFFERITKMMEKESFKNNVEDREKSLKVFRKEIEKGEMPDWMMDELANMQNSFPKGSSIRCRSSTNNEDLPNFSGAGLYDSKTQKPTEGHISKSIKQVYASMWNFRAFEEREFYRINHLVASMGVLCHPNAKDEKVNGVGVSTDPIYHTSNNFYLNSQFGEDLVTNPQAFSIPEEILLDIQPKTADNFILIRYSNLSDSVLLFERKFMNQMRNHLAVIHNRFKKLYKAENNDQFAIEIEYKITKDGYLSIKQARPWLGFNSSPENIVVEEPTFETDILTATFFPNPFDDQLSLTLQSPITGTLNLQVYTQSGQPVFEKDLDGIYPGLSTVLIPIDIRNLPLGLYFAKLALSGENQTFYRTIKIYKNK